LESRSNERLAAGQKRNERLMRVSNILVAEDLDEDVLFLKTAFVRAGVNVPLRFVRNGQKAIQYLKGEEEFANRSDFPMPNLLLLDLKMPRLNGFDVLEWLRLQPDLRRLLVVVLTSSGLAADVNRAYDLGANSYLLKPSGWDEFECLVRQIEDYWLKANLCGDLTSSLSQTPAPPR
jgi:CheY-like chemotaxis protein